jgi:hypothetical protein
MRGGGVVLVLVLLRLVLRPWQRSLSVPTVLFELSRAQHLFWLLWAGYRAR